MSKVVSEKSYGKFKVTYHRPTDPLDVGFKIAGFQLRWISARKSETSAGRPWSVITKDSLPEELAKELAAKRPGLFKDNLLRNGDCVLAMAPIEEINEIKKENERARRDQMAMIERPADLPNNARVETSREQVPTAELLANADGFRRGK